MNSATLRKSIKEYVACMSENGVELPEPNLSGEGPVFQESEVDWMPRDGLDRPEDERRKREEYDELVEYFTRARDLCAELIDALDTRVGGGSVSLTIDHRERDSLQP
jgi:hypothetical protein